VLLGLRSYGMRRARNIACPRCAAAPPTPLGTTDGVVWFMCPSCSLPFHIDERRGDATNPPKAPSPDWKGPDRRRTPKD